MKKFLLVAATALLLATNVQAGGPRGGGHQGGQGHYRQPARQVTIINQGGHGHHRVPRSYYHQPRTVYVDRHYHHHGCGHPSIGEIGAVFLGAVGGAYILSNIF